MPTNNCIRSKTRVGASTIKIQRCLHLSSLLLAKNKIKTFSIMIDYTVTEFHELNIHKKVFRNQRNNM